MTGRVEFRGETLVAVDAVARASDIARARTGAGDVRSKGALDVVTGTDVAVEDRIRDLVGRTLDIPVLGEERGGDVAEVGTVHWLVDPICGTRNFASGIPLYCVNVALVEDGQVSAAVVGDPSAHELWVAERGRGAFRRATGGWEPIRVGEHSATVAIEDSHTDPDRSRRARAAGAVAAAMRAFRWDIRAFSSSLALPYVATGRIAGYALFWASALHVGAGGLLAAEAGAVVSDVDGRPWTLASESIVASASPALHDELLEICAVADAAGTG
jgi:myo-inositol-1(or 4)-monophosphatase